MRLRRHHRKQRKTPHKHGDAQFVPRELNRTHLTIYFALATPLLMLLGLLVFEGVAGYFKYVLLALLIFLYSVCRFPITRGTGKNAADGGVLDFLNLAFKYFLIAVIPVSVAATAHYFGAGTGGGLIPGLSPPATFR